MKSFLSPYDLVACLKGDRFLKDLCSFWRRYSYSGIQTINRVAALIEIMDLGYI